MAYPIDMNEYLLLSKLRSLTEDKKKKAVELRALQVSLQVDEAFFLSTLKPLEKKKLITIGFFKRTQTIRVLNWAEKYSARQELQVSLTKLGQQALQAW